jgi:hypothetical protein
MVTLDRSTHVCSHCHVSWSGGERDCFSCGRPATSQPTGVASALQRLLDLVTVPGADPGPKLAYRQVT